MAKTKHRRFFIYPTLLWLGILAFAASNSVIAKLGQIGAHHLVDGRNPISFCNVLFTGNVIAGITLLIIYRKVWTRENLSKLTGKNWFHLTLLALFTGFLAPTLYFLGLMLTEVINVVLISVVEIPLALFFTYVIGKEKPSMGTALSALFSIVGICIIFLVEQQLLPHSTKLTMINMGDTPLSRFLTSIPFAGGLCIILATVFDTFSEEYSGKVIETIPLGIFSVYRTIMGTIIFFIIVMSVFGPSHFVDIFNPFLIEWMLFYGIAIIAVGLLVWYKGVQNSSNTDQSLASAFEPIAGVIFAYLILNEMPDKGQILGGVIIMIGIAISFYVEAKRKRARAFIGFKGF